MTATVSGELVAEVERLLADLEALPDPFARQTATAVVEGLLELYGAGLERIVEEIAARDEHGQLAAALADDELVAHLLLIHGLHPVALEDRVVEALDSVRPYLESHGGSVELVGLDGAAVRLRMEGSCSGCPSSSVTLKLAIENAIRKRAPEIEEVTAEETPATPLIQIELAPPAPPPAPAIDGSWEMAGGHPNSAARRTEPVVEAQEHCELCGAPVPEAHRHLVDLDAQRMLCACRPCALLFDRQGAGGGHRRLVPDRRLRLDRFELSSAAWERLRIPVDMAFFFRSSRVGRVMAFYPGPMGATESLLELESWEELERANPVLATMEPDVEALLVDRARGSARQWLVPIDDCYRLVGVIRSRWRGFGGGKQVWLEIESFFEELDRSARLSGRA